MSDPPNETRIAALARELDDITRLAAVLEPHERAQAEVMKLLFRQLRQGRGRIDVALWNAAVEEAARRHERTAAEGVGESSDRHRAHAAALRAFLVSRGRRPPST